MILKARLFAFHFITLFATQTLFGKAIQPVFDGLDAKRKKRKVRLIEVAANFQQVTDLQPIPTENDSLLILEKMGALKKLKLKTKQVSTIHVFEVASKSELGLLGAAFSPNFNKDRKLYLYYSPAAGPSKNKTQLSEFEWNEAPGRIQLYKERILLEIEQPYNNHNGGQIAFGPDGYLYIGVGDGGSANDPLSHGQNLSSLLGTILRIDPRQGESRAYTIPKDNPFVGMKNAAPEIWSYGLRNPWRFTFLKDGRLIVADVGQNKWEELNFVSRGQNLGWAIKEGRECFVSKKQCDAQKELVDPLLVYGREDGVSITGGFEYLGSKIPSLKGHYVFTDFGSGRLWAIPLPQKSDSKIPAEKMISLGRWPLNSATMGQLMSGELIVADFTAGKLYELAP